MSVVLPASGWLMIANVRRRAASEITCWDMTCQPTEMASHPTATIDRDRLAQLLRAERDRFVALHPRSAALAAEGTTHLVAGVPMPWMTRWPGAFPIHVAEASGSRFVDVDGIEYVDFCLGDTGAMAGHAAEPSPTRSPSRRRSG